MEIKKDKLIKLAFMIAIIALMIAVVYMTFVMKNYLEVYNTDICSICAENTQYCMERLGGGW